jgi:organic anion transporter 4A
LISIPFLFGVLLNCPLENSPKRSGCPTVRHCSTQFYNPVCDKNTDITYFSPCYAGCDRIRSHFHRGNGKVWAWGNCTCLASGSVSPGECGDSCPVMMAVSLALTTFQQVIQYAGFVSLNVVFQRIVDESDRTIAQGLRQSVRKALGTVPSPLLFGAFIDWYCLIWKESGNGKRGNCWVYDTHGLIFWLCWVQVGLRLLSSLFYYLCWSHYPIRRGSIETPLVADARSSGVYESTALSVANDDENVT